MHQLFSLCLNKFCDFYFFFYSQQILFVDNLLEDSRKIFEDVHADFCDIRKILLKFQEWKEKFPDSYCDAYISFCLPKLLNPLIRFQLINWNPLQVGALTDFIPNLYVIVCSMFYEKWDVFLYTVHLEINRVGLRNWSLWLESP